MSDKIITEEQIKKYCESFCLYNGFEVAIKELRYLANNQETTNNLNKRIAEWCIRNGVD